MGERSYGLEPSLFLKKVFLIWKYGGMRIQICINIVIIYFLNLVIGLFQRQRHIQNWKPFPVHKLLLLRNDEPFLAWITRLTCCEFRMECLEEYKNDLWPNHIFHIPAYKHVTHSLEEGEREEEYVPAVRANPWHPGHAAKTSQLP